MKIQSIRHGFATNSSSSHSVIFYNEPQKIKDTISTNLFEFGNYRYGWEDFVLASKQEKLNYFGTQIYEFYKNFMPEEIALNYINNKWNFSINDKEAHIDHQSILYFPLYKESHTKYFWPNEEFIDELLRYIKKDNVIIYGGNDNTDTDNSLWGEFAENVREAANPVKFKLSDILETSCGSPYDNNSIIYAEKDKKYKFWTLFNWNTGKQLRFSFEDIEIKKSSVPLLIDFKITDYCKYNCDFCYQGSSKKGKHADPKDINNILWSLSNTGVNEISFGGGDCLDYPDFMGLLEDCTRYKIKPNFSTKQTDWLKNKKKREKIFNLIGEVGISINSFKEFETIKNIVKDGRYNYNKIVYHIPMGTITRKDFHDIMKEADWDKFLFLGYKNVGKGKDFKKINYDWLFEEEIKTNKSNRIGIDTCLAKEFESTLKEMEINPIYYQLEEGKFSMYIDAVTMKMAKSSFEENQINIDKTTITESIVDFFKSL